MPDVVLALTTLPEEFDAVTFARDLVRTGVAACVTIVPAVQSVYRWEGQIESSREQQLIVKTTGPQVDALWAAIRSAHPYDVPEFVVVPVTGGNPAYLDWIRG